jgi:hypothetical protein
LTTDGDVYCWSIKPPERNDVVTVPMRAISIGPSAACGIGKDDYVYCWGQAGTGVIADDSNITRTSALVRVVGQP